MKVKILKIQNQIFLQFNNNNNKKVRVKYHKLILMKKMIMITIKIN